MHEAKVGLPNAYNALVYVTFCVGSYLFTLGCFLMTVPIINEVSLHAHHKCFHGKCAHHISDLQASWPHVGNIVDDRQSCTAGACKRLKTDALAWQSRATQIAFFCGSSRVLTCECLHPSTGSLSVCKSMIYSGLQCIAEVFF